ncbi:nicotinate-nucleotide adenylyltransferase [Mycoplasmopsis cricetuli]|uniref:nicotinate-nucleotide adenylyltransferase n=1 Tax=Mycoplasmopsis cricetuli TaxID=171283 RepID=UPI0004725903|nr:nicotinate-nucleotide adenylyltransferase [Mycoplasmopsis cricetuli]
MKIAIFGGSFDPIHIGHVKIAQYAIENLKLDKLIFVPTNISPFKLKSKPASNLDRLNMIKLICKNKMEVSDFEIKRNGPSYTIDTVKYFARKYPNDQLYLIIGSDNVSKLHKWENIELISKLVQIVVFKRDAKINKTNIKKFNAMLLNNPIWKISSTEIRGGNLNFLDLKVLNYIQNNNLYLEKIIHSTLSALRAKHCMSTGNFAAEMAKKFNVNAKQAYLAGILHDIAKEWSEEDSRNYINYFEPSFKDVQKHELHQICGYIWAKHWYKLQDPEILHAILVHTTLDDGTDSDLSKLDKILFISDKISNGRRFEGIQKLRKLAFEDLDQAFSKVVEYVYNYNLNKNVKFSERQEKIYRKYLSK